MKALNYVKGIHKKMCEPENKVSVTWQKSKKVVEFFQTINGKVNEWNELHVSVSVYGNLSLLYIV